MVEISGTMETTVFDIQQAFFTFVDNDSEWVW